MKLEGRNAIVVGGGRNAGRAICVGLAREGANVAVVVRANRQEAEETAQLVRAAGAKSLVVLADVRAYADAVRCVEETNRALGFVDIMVFTVGVRPLKSFLEVTPDEWRDVMATNVDGAFNFARTVLPQMVERKRGCIVYLTGTSAYQGRGRKKVSVGTSKGAVRALTHALAAEFGPCGIRVNSVAPTNIKVRRTRPEWYPEEVYPGEADESKGLEHVPLGRRGVPEDVAAAVVFLATDDANFITGQAIHVNGGFVMS